MRLVYYCYWILLDNGLQGCVQGICFMSGRPSLLSVSEQIKSKPLIIFAQKSHRIHLFLNSIIQFNTIVLLPCKNTGYVSPEN